MVGDIIPERGAELSWKWVGDIRAAAEAIADKFPRLAISRFQDCASAGQRRLHTG